MIDRTAMQKLNWIIPNQDSLPAALAKIKSARIALAKYVQVRPAAEATQSSD